MSSDVPLPVPQPHGNNWLSVVQGYGRHSLSYWQLVKLNYILCQHLKCETEAWWQNICVRGLYTVLNANCNKTNWLWSSKGSDKEILAAFLCSWYFVNKLGPLNQKTGVWETLGANLYLLLDYSDNLFKLRGAQRLGTKPVSEKFWSWKIAGKD